MPRVSDDAVKEKTQRTWDEWFSLLDAEGAKEWDHARIARELEARHGVTPWWAQSVTVEYEKARGLRVMHERAEGTFAASASKAIGVSAARLFDALTSESDRADWLPEGELSVRTATAPKSARFDWNGGPSRVNFHLTDKGPDKAQLSLEHEKLPDAAEAERMKAFWRERLTALKAHLEG